MKIYQNLLKCLNLGFLEKKVNITGQMQGKQICQNKNKRLQKRGPFENPQK